jgi:3-hydroxyisobutyrate dehydrogenase
MQTGMEPSPFTTFLTTREPDHQASRKWKSREDKMAIVGFAGLGNMGGPMAVNLIKAGHELQVFDLSQAAVSKVSQAGAHPAATAAEMANGAEFVITMLPAGQQVREIYLGPEGLIASAAPGSVLVDCSTIDVSTARAVSAEAERAGIEMLDAPVSGGVTGAEAGTLTFMVGGKPSAFARAEPILSKMGKTVVHAGASGNGQAAKICNNMILGVSMIAVCEAFALGEKLGLSNQTLFDIASKSSGQCWSLTSYCPVPGPVPASPANRDYTPGFTAAMMLKDLKLAQEAARLAGANTPLGAEAAALYQLFASHGGKEADFSGIVKFLRAQT